MAFYDACHVGQANVTKLDIKFVANFVELAVWGKVFVEEVKEIFSDIRFHLFGEVVEFIGYAVHDECPDFFKASAYGRIALSNDLRPNDSGAILLLIM